ncbi:MAG: hypothetical protein E5V49_00490 [Mesorhizobium sp.]|nr:hypothetical protein EN848_31120 [bacterium M00.F.Ca.ET.205.01.1.1]TGU46724.1 hypothetical protein EN795_31515 [bacterium M00.F.Ca.ET.152.01.1.1]TGV31815.1 hypothetical protein EN829_031190 [Mesorhizobium sp. M00.F.Ca.ET.186.01.1.1]TGZ38982.1 hypothetical protein EN805_31110 [bacterium M00.F.Ca.ET.162.01.1.1]TIW63075.1 MAG: hypothetical protein E5V48_00880 [Mesorhizobium sp.]
MMNPKLDTSNALVVSLADLQRRMREAGTTAAEMNAFEKVASIMDDGHGRIDGDDLIAASFLVDPGQQQP